MSSESVPKKKEDDSSVIVVVLLLTKPTLTGLSVGTSSRPDCWTDTMTEVLSFSLSQFPSLTPRLDSLGGLDGVLARAGDVSVTPEQTSCLDTSERQQPGTVVSI